MNKSIGLIIAVMASFWLFSCHKPTTETPALKVTKVKITFNNICNGKPLVKGPVIYSNIAGESFGISAFKYYISNIILRNQETGQFYRETNSYHLFSLDSGTTKTIILYNLPKGNYSQLEFSVGVDNAANHDIDNLGELDPGNDMAWSWNTGYKFMVMEGKFKTTTDSGKYVYHIGNDENFRTLKLPFTGNGKTIAYGVSADTSLLINLKVEASQIFGKPNQISLLANPNVQFQAGLAGNVADNYSNGMFYIDQISRVPQ